MKKHFARVLALSGALIASRFAYAAISVDERFERTVLEDELALLAHADARETSSRYPIKPASEMAVRWQKYEHRQEKLFSDMGKYADLRRSPNRPPYASSSAHEHLFSLDVKYAFADRYFNGYGAAMDPAHAFFTSNPIKVQDVMMASKIVDQEVAEHKNDYVPVPRSINADGYAPITGAPFATNSAYFGYLANSEIKFTSERHRLDIGIKGMRYLFDRRIALGFYIPVVHEYRSLHLDLDFDLDAYTQQNNNIDSLSAAAYRYDGVQAMLTDFFQAKGMNSFGGTGTGIGDVQLYGQVHLDVAHLDQAFFGMRVVLPTAPYASTDILWGPERGNGGFYQSGIFLSAAGNYGRLFNPHIFVEGLYSLPGTVNKHVPKMRTIKRGMTQAQLAQTGITLAYRLDTPAKDYQDFDATYRWLGDTVAAVKIAKGLVYGFRVGNLIEQVFVRRANLDLFYALKLTERDRLYDLPANEYNTLVCEKDSDRVEHRIGFEWRWQINGTSALTLGAEQVVWGKNIIQDTQVSAAFNYGF